jgi:hypothetical protein
MADVMSKEYQDMLVAACGLYDCKGSIVLDRQRAEILIASIMDPEVDLEMIDEALASGKPLYPPDHPTSIHLDKVMAEIEVENLEVARMKRLMAPALRAAVRGEAPAKRRSPATKLETGRRILAELYPGGVPDTVKNKPLHAEMCKAGFTGDYSTAMRAAGRRK